MIPLGVFLYLGDRTLPYGCLIDVEERSSTIYQPWYGGCLALQGPGHEAAHEETSQYTNRGMADA